MFSKFSLDKHLPYRSHYFEIDGYRLHFFDEGRNPRIEKEAVVLLHGNPTWSFYYRSLIADLKNSTRVIAPDHIGCGLSDHPPDKHFRAADRTRHLEALLDYLKIERFSLVMHDWGGPIGTNLAVRRSSSVAGLVYLNTTLTETESLPAVVKMAATPLLGKYLTKYSTRFIRAATELGVCNTLPGEIKAGYLYPYATAARRTAIWDFVRDIPFSSSHPTYSAMLDMAAKFHCLDQVPVLIVWGLKDPCFNRDMLRQVAGHFPQARVVEIPTASHLVLEDAADKVCREIRCFLCGEPDEAGREKIKAVQEKAALDKAGGAHALYASFCREASIHPDADAVITPLVQRLPLGLDSLVGRQAPPSYRHVQAQELFSLINQYQRGLIELGLKKQDRVLVLVRPGVDFLALTYAVMGRGAVPILVDPGIGTANLIRCIADAAPDAMIGSPKAQLLRLVGQSALKRLKFSVTCSDWFPVTGINLGFFKKFSCALPPDVNLESKEVGLVAFTSGATGTPKGVIFTNGMLAAQLAIFSKTFGISSGKLDLPLLPAFSLFNLAAGVCSVFPPMDPSAPLELEPSVVVRIVRDLNISYSFGSPTLWNKLAEYCIRHQISLPSLDKVFMAGAPVSDRVIGRVKSVIPRGEAFTPYGATEALPVTLVSASQLETIERRSAKGGEIGTPVGQAVEGVQVKVIKAVDGPVADISHIVDLEPLEIGEIIIKGDGISPAYLNRPDANRNSKIKDGAGFWHRIGDMGYMSPQGQLFFCGRKAHVVRCKGKVHYSIPVEHVFNQHRKVRRSALVALYGGREPGVVVEPHPEHWPEDAEARRAFSAELAELAKESIVTADLQRFFFHRSFPVDARHNAKIFRDKLGEWASTVKENPWSAGNM